MDWDACLKESGNNRDNGKVAFTFDDGFQDFRRHVLPAIERAGIRVLLFVTTGFVDQMLRPYEYVIGEVVKRSERLIIQSKYLNRCVSCEGLLNQYLCLLSKLKKCRPEVRNKIVSELLCDNAIDETELEVPEMLDWEELRDLVRHPLVDVGAHSIFHAFLPALSVSAAWREIYGSKSLLESKLECNIEAFAYPYGAHNLLLRWMVKRSGYKYGFATENGCQSRVGIPRTDIASLIRGGNSCANIEC